MKLLIENIGLRPGQQESEIKEIIKDLYDLKIDEFAILKKSLDARKKDNILYRYRVLIEVPDVFAKEPLLLQDNISEFKEEKRA